MAIVQPWRVLSVHGGTVSSNPLCSSGEVRNEPSPEVMLVSPIFRDLPILLGRGGFPQ